MAKGVWLLATLSRAGIRLLSGSGTHPSVDSLVRELERPCASYESDERVSNVAFLDSALRTPFGVTPGTRASDFQTLTVRFGRHTGFV